MIFIESKAFTRRLLELAGDAADSILCAIQGDLLANPTLGDVVPGLGGIRKGRASNPARRKGKRGGLRYLFLYLERRQHIHLLLLLDKGERADMDSAERAMLRQLVARIKK